MKYTAAGRTLSVDQGRVSALADSVRHVHAETAAYLTSVNGAASKNKGGSERMNTHAACWLFVGITLLVAGESSASSSSPLPPLRRTVRVGLDPGR